VRDDGGGHLHLHLCRAHVRVSAEHVSQPLCVPDVCIYGDEPHGLGIARHLPRLRLLAGLSRLKWSNGQMLFASQIFLPACDESRGACHACPFAQYLSCDGLGCNDCPPGFVSNTGSLSIAECKPFGQWIFQFKGPVGEGRTSQAIAPHRHNLPPHTPFDTDAFLRDAAATVGSELAHLRRTGPAPLTHFPESRATQLAGATIFQVTIEFAVNGTSDSDRITRALLAPMAALPPARQAARRRLLSRFQLLSIASITEPEPDASVSCLPGWIYVAGEPVLLLVLLFVVVVVRLLVLVPFTHIHAYIWMDGWMDGWMDR
jgi:hypothetical protein